MSAAAVASVMGGSTEKVIWEEDAIVLLGQENALDEDCKAGAIWGLVRFLGERIDAMPLVKGHTRYELKVTNVHPNDGYKPTVKQTVTIAMKELDAKAAALYYALTASYSSASTDESELVDDSKLDDTEWVLVARVKLLPSGKTRSAVATHLASKAVPTPNTATVGAKSQNG